LSLQLLVLMMLCTSPVGQWLVQTAASTFLTGQSVFLPAQPYVTQPTINTKENNCKNMQ
jgi:hypothetical protein